MASRPLVARLRTAPLVALVAAAWLALLAGPAGATNGSTRLIDPEVSPRSGTTKTVVSFSVVYRNREGSPADWVRVRVAGVTHEMRPLDPVDQTKRGVRYAFVTTLPVGQHAVTFSSSGRDKFTDSVAAGTVTIKAASSGGSGGGGSGGTSPGGGSSAESGSGGGSGGGGSGGTSPGGGSSAESGSGSGSVPPAGGEPSSGAAPALPGPPAVSALDMEPTEPRGAEPPGAEPQGAEPRGAEPLDLTDPSLRPGTDAIGPAAQADPGIAGHVGGTRDGGGPHGASRIPGVDLPGERLGRLVPVIVLTSATTTLAMAFLLFGKRRRDEEPPAPEPDLAHAAARPYGFVTTGALALAPAGAAAGCGAVPAFDPGTGGTDVNLPRWRRPSLLAARRSDPLRDASAAVHLTFSSAGAGAGGERRRIRYRIVRLLDRPDELGGMELGSLDEGDEVEIVEQHGTYRRVVTPDGREGWLHKMTLGDVVGADGETSGFDEAEIDADVLLAYLAARARG